LINCPLLRDWLVCCSVGGKMFDKLFSGGGKCLINCSLLRDWLVCCSVGGKMFDKLFSGGGKCLVNYILETTELA
jgi:hypothetical protein